MQVDKLFVAAKALIVFQSKVLILKEAATNTDGTNMGAYLLPGGRIDPGESFLDGLRREIHEETGIVISDIRQPVEVHDWWPIVRGEQWHIVGIFVLCPVQTNAVTLSSEHDAYEWIDPKQYRDWNIVTNEQAVFEAYLETLKPHQ